MRGCINAGETDASRKSLPTYVMIPARLERDVVVFLEAPLFIYLEKTGTVSALL